jgi:hypothetical protein
LTGVPAILRPASGANLPGISLRFGDATLHFDLQIGRIPQRLPWLATMGLISAAKESATSIPLLPSHRNARTSLSFQGVTTAEMLLCPAESLMYKDVTCKANPGPTVFAASCLALSADSPSRRIAKNKDIRMTGPKPHKQPPLKHRPVSAVTILGLIEWPTL